MYQVKVNDQFNFEVNFNDDQITVNGQEISIDQFNLNNNTSHILYQNQSHLIELVDLNREEKIASVKVNGNIYSINVKDKYDLLLKQLGMDNMASTKILQVKAPMPGLVLNVLVSNGDGVKKGDNLLVLEAMKMENMLKSPTDGVIKNVHIKQGDKVEKNELLISFS